MTFVSPRGLISRTASEVLIEPSDVCTVKLASNKPVLLPDSTPYLEPESGTITFSETAEETTTGGARRIGSGARILFWRELRTDER